MAENQTKDELDKKQNSDLNSKDEQQKADTGEKGSGETAENAGQAASSDQDKEESRAKDGSGEGAENDSKTEKGSAKESSSEKKGFFKKKEKKDPKDEKIAELTDRLQRQLAEFDNYRKRTEKEKSLMYQVGAKDVIEKLLPIVDNFERAVDAEGQEKDDPFVDGINKIYKQLTTMLTDLGVKPIEAVGKEFDSDLHNAVMHVDDENVGENVVVEEFQKGYTYKDSVVRHSMVKVAN